MIGLTKLIRETCQDSELDLALDLAEEKLREMPQVEDLISQMRELVETGDFEGIPFLANQAYSREAAQMNILYDSLRGEVGIERAEEVIRQNIDLLLKRAEDAGARIYLQKLKRQLNASYQNSLKRSS